MNEEITVLEIDEILTTGINSINEKDLPEIISSQIAKFNELDLYVKKSKDAADKAKNSADLAKRKSVGTFKNKEAIEELQSAGLDIAEAVQFGAEAQKLSFEFQSKLAEITKYLFSIGVSNIASNRFVIRELEIMLKGASQEKLSDLARQELLTVIKQLKDQEDILMRQENITKQVKSHDVILKNQNIKNLKITEQLKAHSDKDRQHDEKLKLHEEANIKLEEKVQAQVELDRLQSEQLQAYAEIDILHDEQIKLHAENEKKLVKKLEEQEEVDRVHAEQLKIHAENDNKLEVLLVTQAENDKEHDEKLRTQNENVLNCEEQIAILFKESIKQKEQIEKNIEIVKKQEINLNDLQDEISKLKLVLDTKANYTLLGIVLGIASVSFVISIIACFL